MSQGQLDEIYERAQALLSSGDYRSAFIELEKIALKGHIPAMSMMGYLYEVGKGTEPDIYKAVEWYKKSAEGGSNTAQYNLASCYKNGKGVKKDLCEAVRWFTASAEQGNTRAQYTLAYRHLNGEGTPQCNEDYIKWMTKSATGGNLNAQFALGCDYFDGTNGVEKSIEKAEIFLKRPAQGGNSRAQLLLGRIYKKGGAVPRDEKRAFELFELCAEREPEGRYELGLCYYNSIGVKKSYYTAMRYIKAAADAGVEKAQKFIEAQNRVEEEKARRSVLLKSYVKAITYREDAEIEDLIKACQLCEETLNPSDAFAVRAFAKMRYWLALAYYKRDTEDPSNARLARQKMEKSAELGYDEAQFRLAEWYFKDYGLSEADTHDYEPDAIRLLKSAAEQGHKGAKAVLDALQ